MENKDTKREPNFKKGAIVVYLEYIAQDKRFMVREVGAGLSEEENKWRECREIDFPTLLKRTREELGLTQSEFGRGFGVGLTTVSMWENGKRKVGKDVVEFLVSKELDRAREVTGETSDGYHTFNELYEHRHLLFSKLAEWKSRKHSDGSMFDGWFIAGIGKEKGEQITYHIPLRLWDSFNCEELDTAPEWDGHTANDVLKRLTKLTTK